MTPEEIERRDRFAEGAMHALMTAGYAFKSHELLAEKSYAIADAMMEARKPKP